MSDLTLAEPNLANHCECGAPMTVLLNHEGLYRDGSHDPERETHPGLATVLDEHHRAMLCGFCDGTDAFDVKYHYEWGSRG